MQRGEKLCFVMGASIMSPILFMVSADHILHEQPIELAIGLITGIGALILMLSAIIALTWQPLYTPIKERQFQQREY